MRNSDHISLEVQQIDCATKYEIQKSKINFYGKDKNNCGNKWICFVGTWRSFYKK